jgi:hypothetical protein
MCSVYKDSAGTICTQCGNLSRLICVPLSLVVLKKLILMVHLKRNYENGCSFSSYEFADREVACN